MAVFEKSDWQMKLEMKLEIILDFCVRDLYIYFRAISMKKHYLGKLQHRRPKDSA